jgi:mono/diheme cytochrome c family protein
MKPWSITVLVLVVLVAVVYGVAVIRRGFSAADQPSGLERVMARAVRNVGIPRRARDEKNPLTADPEVLAEANERFGERCANCHGNNGNGESNIGKNLYPKAPDLRLPPTQHLTDGEIHYIIRNGVRLTGMPAWGNPHIEQDDTDAWKLVLFVRSIAGLTPQEKSQQIAVVKSAHYVGSTACQKCHERICAIRVSIRKPLFLTSRRTMSARNLEEKI